MEYGCIGERLGHSFSREVHRRLASYDYCLRELKKEELEEFFQKKEFRAINVTIPYKEAVLPYLDEIDDAARAIGAVNTVVQRDGKLYGYNTDFMGMEALSRRIGIDFSQKKVLILGTGGTSKTAAAVAKSLGAREVILVSRRVGVTYELARKEHRDADIIINTTPCGMYPDSDASPIDLSDYPKAEAVLDAIYNPLATRLVSDARKKGLRAEGGLYMLVAQAVFAAQHFLGIRYPEGTVEKVFGEILAQKQNVVLTGMPGSGKSTVGRLLARRMGREWIDTDERIESLHGAISEIFKAQGEAAFRDLETEAVTAASKQCGCVISTGGGAILREENLAALRRNGKIFFLDRPPEALIPTEDRPLSRDRESITRRYKERYEIYRSTADVQVDGKKSPEEIAEIIMKEMNFHENYGH